jgi:hypothetical protein
MRVQLAEEILEGERDDLIVRLRDRKMSYREIAELVLCSRTTVGNVLNSQGVFGRLQYRELLDPKTFEEQDDQKIASVLGISTDRVARARRTWLGVSEEPGTVSLSARRQFLAQVLFSRDPGPKFGDWLMECTNNGMLGPKQANLVREFYVLGKGKNDDYTRYFRFYARQMLFRRLRGTDIEELIEKEVLV